MGFEPTRACALPVFKTGAINHSTTPPEIPFGKDTTVVAVADRGKIDRPLSRPRSTTAATKNGSTR